MSCVRRVMLIAALAFCLSDLARANPRKKTKPRTGTGARSTTNGDNGGTTSTVTAADKQKQNAMRSPSTAISSKAEDKDFGMDKAGITDKQVADVKKANEDRMPDDKLKQDDATYLKKTCKKGGARGWIGDNDMTINQKSRCAKLDDQNRSYACGSCIGHKAWRYVVKECPGEVIQAMAMSSFSPGVQWLTNYATNTTGTFNQEWGYEQFMEAGGEIFKDLCSGCINVMSEWMMGTALSKDYSDEFCGQECGDTKNRLWLGGVSVILMGMAEAAEVGCKALFQKIGDDIKLGIDEDTQTAKATMVTGIIIALCVVLVVSSCVWGCCWYNNCCCSCCYCNRDDVINNTEGEIETNNTECIA